MRDLPGHDINFQAIGGALAPRHGEEPIVPRLPAADLETGTVAALLICAAWSRRLRDGVGERIDVAMADVMAWWVGPRSGTAHTGATERTFGSPVTSGLVANRSGVSSTAVRRSAAMARSYSARSGWEPPAAA